MNGFAETGCETNKTLKCIKTKMKQKSTAVEIQTNFDETRSEFQKPADPKKNYIKDCKDSYGFRSNQNPKFKNSNLLRGKRL